MAYHNSNLGAYAPTEHADMDGYIPEAEDGPWDLNWDHGSERTHNDDGSLTEYGEWWEEEWPERRAEAVKATRKAERELAK